MSTLNQAFIKAYQRRGIGAPHMPMPAARSAQVAAAPPEVESPPGIILRSDAPTVRPEIADAAGVESAAGILTRSVTPTVCAEAAATAGDDDLRPTYEVERFEWPGVVISLLDQTRLELTALAGELLPRGRGALLVSGCRRGEGRTSVALMLARYFVENGASVALVDADLDKPGTAASLGAAIDVGWEQTLTENMPLGEALIESLGDRVTLLPLRRPVEEAALAAGGAGLSVALKRLQAEFDVVCIDAGPLAQAGSVRHENLFGDAPIEAAVVVRDARHCRPEQSYAVGRKLVQRGLSRWAIIENFV